MTKFIFATLGTLFVTFLLWFTLKTSSDQKVFQPREPQIFSDTFQVIAHRGASKERPENTLPAFDLALEINPQVVLEMDVHLTQDNRVVVFHDDLLERTTNGRGLVKEKTYAELQKLDAAYMFKNNGGGYPFRGQGVQIPLFDTVLKKYSAPIIVELKNKRRALAQKMIELLKKHNAFHRVLIGSEYAQPLIYFRREAPESYTTASFDEALRFLSLVGVQLAGLTSLYADVFCIPPEYNSIAIASSEFLSAAQKRHKKVFVWTVNKKNDMEKFIHMKVDGIVSDDVRLLTKVSRQLTQNESQ